MKQVIHILEEQLKFCNNNILQDNIKRCEKELAELKQAEEMRKIKVMELQKAIEALKALSDDQS